MTRSAWLGVVPRQTVELTAALPRESPEVNLQLPAGSVLVSLADGADVFAFQDNWTWRIDGRTGKRVWGDEKQAAILSEYSTWPPLTDRTETLLFCAARDRIDLRAVALADGAVRWHRRSEPPAGVDATNAAALAAPLLADLDGDDVLDVVAVYGSRMVGTSRIWLEAVSGSKGTPLWQQDVDLGGPIEPDPMRGVAGAVGGSPGRRSIALASTRRLTVLDARTGQPTRPPLDFFAPLIVPPRFFKTKDGGLWLPCVYTQAPGYTTLTLRDGLTGQTHWAHGAAGPDDALTEWNRTDPLGLKPSPSPLSWPQMITVEGAPALLTLAPPGRPGGPYGLKARDVRSEVLRWHAPEVVRHTTDRIVSLSGMVVIVAVRDGGGVVQSGRGPYVLEATALDAATGKTRWHRRHPLPHPNRSMPAPEAGEPLAWAFGTRGQPLLVVPVVYLPRSGLAVLDTGDGREVGWLDGADAAQVGDCDDDGIPDLLVRFANQQTNAVPSPAREFRPMRGGAPEVWRRLVEKPPRIVGDLDGDGVRDVIVGNATVSGRTGRMIWRTDATMDRAVSGETTESDFNGDGVPDLVVPQYQERNRTWPLSAVSGKDGRVMWRADPIATGTPQKALIGVRVQSAAFRRLDASGPPCVLAALIEEGRSARETGAIAAFDGADGRLRWRAPGRPVGTEGFAVQDLNGDGTADVVAPVLEGDGYRLRALNGRDGRVLWERRNPGHPQAYPRRLLVAPGGVLAVWADNTTRFALAFHAAEDGAPRWVYEHEGPFQDNSFGSPSPLGLVPWGPGGQPLVFLTRPTGDRKQYEFVFLDLQGSEFRKWSRVAGREPTAEPRIDVLNAGRDTFLLAHVREERWGPASGKGVQLERDDNVLALLSDAEGTVRWHRPMKFGHYVWRTEPGDPSLVTVVQDEQMVGVDATTGRLRWRCRADGERLGLLDLPTSEAPRLLFATAGGAICRRGFPIDELGRPTPTTGPADDFAPISEPLQVRMLPWAEAFPRDGVPPAVVGLALLAPAGLLLLLLMRRWRGFVILLGILLLGPIVFAVVLLGIDAVLFRRAGESYSSEGWYFLPLLWSLTTGLLFLPGYGLWEVGRWAIGRFSR